MTDASSLASGWAFWAETFDVPKAEGDEDEETERFDRLGAASCRLVEPVAESDRDAPLVPFTACARRGVRESPPACAERCPPVLVGCAGWCSVLRIVDGARG
jgi:hypothetical protein